MKNIFKKGATVCLALALMVSVVSVNDISAYPADQKTRIRVSVNDSSADHADQKTRISVDGVGGECKLEKYGPFYKLIKGSSVLKGKLFSPKDPKALSEEIKNRTVMALAEGKKVTFSYIEGDNKELGADIANYEQFLQHTGYEKKDKGDGFYLFSNNYNGPVLYKKENVGKENAGLILISASNKDKEVLKELLKLDKTGQERIFDCARERKTNRFPVENAVHLFKNESCSLKRDDNGRLVFKKESIKHDERFKGGDSWWEVFWSDIAKNLNINGPKKDKNKTSKNTIKKPRKKNKNS
jgi:hypothetical protein